MKCVIQRCEWSQISVDSQVGFLRLGQKIDSHMIRCEDEKRQLRRKLLLMCVSQAEVVLFLLNNHQ